MTAFDTEDDILPRAGVIGWPVDHSRSPKLHGFWLAQYGLSGRYDRLPVPPEEVGAFLEALPKEPGFRGVNVTIPNKVVVLPYLAEIDPVARRIGAVNTIVVREDGSLHGSNTDAFGFLASLRADAPKMWRAANGPAVVLGAGGASRAIIVALLDAGTPELRLTNRSRDKAEALAAEFGSRIQQPSTGTSARARLPRPVCWSTPPASAWAASPPSTCRSTTCRSPRWSTTSFTPHWKPVCWLRPRAREPGGGWRRHAAASGPAGLRGVVRRCARGDARTAGCGAGMRAPC